MACRQRGRLARYSIFFAGGSKSSCGGAGLPTRQTVRGSGEPRHMIIVAAMVQKICVIRLLAVLLFFLSAGPCPAFQEPKPKTPPRTPLTDEEKEILKNREILENLDLLQDFEKFRYFDYFASDESGDKSEPGKKPAIKKEVKKEEKK
jgi:hypothetical protein